MAGAEFPLVCAALFVVAVLFSAVGHAGASGYIAVLTLFGYSAQAIRPIGDHPITRVQAFGLQSLLIALWLGYNLAHPDKGWDPYPFILLNLILSCLASVQAPIIMMSQNRQDAKDRLRGELDLVRIYSRRLFVHEAVGNWRAGRPTAPKLPSP